MKGALVGKVRLIVTIPPSQTRLLLLFRRLTPPTPALRMLCVQRHAGRRPSALPPARAPPLLPSPCTAQEAAIFGALANFTHHGMIFVPIGYRFDFTSFNFIQDFTAYARHTSPLLPARSSLECIRLPLPHAAACRSSPTWKKFTAPVPGAQVPPPPPPPRHILDSFPPTRVAQSNQVASHPLIFSPQIIRHVLQRGRQPPAEQDRIGHRQAPGHVRVMVYGGGGGGDGV
jgi:hypothetical protein